MTLLDTIQEGMSGLEKKLASVIPGYRGYKAKELRREADKVLRDTIVSRMRTAKTKLDALQQDLISGGHFDLLDEAGSAVTQIQTFIDRVRTASYGYSGLFDAVRVKEDALDRLYAFDAQLMDYVERIEAAIESAQAKVESKGNELRAAILEIRNLAREANATFDQRREYINQTQDM